MRVIEIQTVSSSNLYRSNFFFFGSDRFVDQIAENRGGKLLVMISISLFNPFSYFQVLLRETLFITLEMDGNTHTRSYASISIELCSYQAILEPHHTHMYCDFLEICIL